MSLSHQDDGRASRGYGPSGTESKVVMSLVSCNKETRSTPKELICHHVKGQVVSMPKYIHRYFMKIGLVVCSLPGTIVFLALPPSGPCILMQGGIEKGNDFVPRFGRTYPPPFSTGVNSRAFPMLS